MTAHRESSVAVSPSNPPPGQNQSRSGAITLNSSLARRTVWQLASVFGVSVVLGFAFNASSPVGVRFSEAGSESLAKTTAPANQASSPPVLAPTNRMATLPPIPTPPAEKPAVTRAIISPPAPIPLPAPSHPPKPPATPTNAAPQISSAAVTTATSPTTPPAEPNPAPIHWAQAKPLVASNKAVLVDVRAKGMYDAGHIPGATSLPETSSPEEFKTFLSQQVTNLTVIVYCSSTSCSQSARVAARLVNEFHWPSVKFMTGGYLEYQQAELTKTPPATTQ